MQSRSQRKNDSCQAYCHQYLDPDVLPFSYYREGRENQCKITKIDPCVSMDKHVCQVCRKHVCPAVVEKTHNQGIPRLLEKKKNLPQITARKYGRRNEHDSDFFGEILEKIEFIRDVAFINGM